MRYLYCHGFASGPSSSKGVKFGEHYAAKGIALERLNLRVPSFEHLRLSAMIDVVQNAIDDGAVVFGSSLGGLTAARTAERDPRIKALVLMAPAFGLAERWQDMLGEEFTRWQQTGWREVTDFTTGKPARVDFGFIDDARAIDVGWPDVKVPTVIVHGVNDETVPVERSRAFAQGRSNVKLVEVDDGHELVKSVPRILAEADALLASLP
ncbi:MAG TPA: YqiA/YcfP family alpha/beta fold hydrolase [Kofleriaceae bacterium]